MGKQCAIQDGPAGDTRSLAEVHTGPRPLPSPFPPSTDARGLADCSSRLGMASEG